MKKLFLLASVLITGNVTHAQWQADVRLTNQSSTSITAFNYKSIGASGNVVHVVWYDDRDGNYEIYYKRSADNGISWGADTRLTNNSGTSWFASLTVAGLEMHVIWMDDREGNFEIYYKRSTDGGLTWSGDTRLTNDNAISQFPSIAVSGPVVNVIWQDSRDGNTEIYYKRSADAGISWGSDTRLTNNAAGSMFASVSASGLIVNVLWEEYRDGNAEIYDKHSADGGVSWSADARLTNNASESFSPSVYTSGLEVHAVWYDTRDGNAEIYYKRSTDGGVSWGTDTRLTNNSSGSYHPSVSASCSNVHLTWYDERDGNREIYYKLSTDAGVSWGTDTRLTNNSSESSHPTAAVSGQVVHVVWQDVRNGNWEIYYKRNPSGNQGSPCCSPPTSTEATITAGGPITFCKGSNVVLTVAGAGLTYQWKKGNTIQSGATQQSFTTAKSGNYKCDVSNSCGTTTSNTIAVTQNPKPTASISQAACSGGAVLLTCTFTPGGVTFKWKKGSTVISGATNSTYSATQSATYKCIVTIVATGCSKTSAGSGVTINCKSGEVVNDNKVIVYPNPSSDYFNINAGQLDPQSVICIYDLTGRLVESHEVNGGEMKAGESLSNGVYFLQITTNNEVRQVIKLVKSF